MQSINPDEFVLKSVLGTIHCEPNWRWRKRDKPMPNYDLFYVWDGEGTVVLNRKSYDVSKGHCFLFKPGDEIHATHNPQKPLSITYIHFDLSKTPQMVPPSHQILRNTINFEALLAQYTRLFLVKTFGADIEAKLILKQLMIHLLREVQEKETQKSKTSDRIVEIIQEIANYIQEHPAELHTVESLAARANLSERYFANKFKKIIGKTVKSYIVYARIKRAEHLLHFSGMTVTETAYALGYNDLHFFSRQFKKYTGKNPSEVR